MATVTSQRQEVLHGMPIEPSAKKTDMTKENPHQLTTYINRPSRIALDLPFELRVAGVVTGGQTVNVSESGLFARLDVPVELWMVGEISMTVGAYYIELDVRVARTHGDGYGLSFLLDNPNDHRAVRVLNDYALSLLTGVAMRQSKAY